VQKIKKNVCKRWINKRCRYLPWIQLLKARAFCPVVQLLWLRASHCTDYRVTSLLFLRVTCPCSLRTYATLKFIRSSSSSSSSYLPSDSVLSTATELKSYHSLKLSRILVFYIRSSLAPVRRLSMTKGRVINCRPTRYMIRWPGFKRHYRRYNYVN